MTRITEHGIESFAIELFDKLGYEYIYTHLILPPMVKRLKGNDKNRPAVYK
ncbi:MAG: hypothetical protein ACOXZV_02225 [Bacteroidales bacterium]